MTSPVAAGTMFSYTVTSSAGVLASFSLAPGTCYQEIEVASGDYVVDQDVPAMIPVTDIMGDPLDALIGSNLAAGTATVRVPSGYTIFAIFFNTPTP